ncbi:hypothetical protein DFH09DRAFT_1083421 [Mycena vulgaris]|nr:hypothetical protein DFH09DRAFT_1083421 [Mycena vulgaris]
MQLHTLVIALFALTAATHAAPVSKIPNNDVLDARAQQDFTSPLGFTVTIEGSGAGTYSAKNTRTSLVLTAKGKPTITVTQWKRWPEITLEPWNVWGIYHSQFVQMVTHVTLSARFLTRSLRTSLSFRMVIKLCIYADDDVPAGVAPDGAGADGTFTVGGAFAAGGASAVGGAPVADAEGPAGAEL